MNDSIYYNVKSRIDYLKSKGQDFKQDKQLMYQYEDLEKTWAYLKNEMTTAINEEETEDKTKLKYKKGTVLNERYTFKNDKKLLMNPLLKQSLTSSAVKLNLTNLQTPTKAVLFGTREMITSDKLSDFNERKKIIHESKEINRHGFERNNINNLTTTTISKKDPLSNEYIIDTIK